MCSSAIIGLEWGVESEQYPDTASASLRLFLAAAETLRVGRGSRLATPGETRQRALDWLALGGVRSPLAFRDEIG